MTGFQTLTLLQYMFLENCHITWMGVGSGIDREGIAGQKPLHLPEWGSKHYLLTVQAHDNYPDSLSVTFLNLNVSNLCWTLF